MAIKDKKVVEFRPGIRQKLKIEAAKLGFSSNELINRLAEKFLGIK